MTVWTGKKRRGTACFWAQTKGLVDGPETTSDRAPSTADIDDRFVLLSPCECGRHPRRYRRLGRLCRVSRCLVLGRVPPIGAKTTRMKPTKIPVKVTKGSSRGRGSQAGRPANGGGLEGFWTRREGALDPP